MGGDMKKQFDLPFNGFPPFVRNSDTSFLAAERIEPSAGTLRQVVLNQIRLGGGMTCDAIEVVLDMRHQTASARIRELALSGHVVDTGDRRKTRSGRLAVVWRA